MILFQVSSLSYLYIPCGSSSSRNIFSSFSLGGSVWRRLGATFRSHPVLALACSASQQSCRPVSTSSPLASGSINPRSVTTHCVPPPHTPVASRSLRPPRKPAEVTKSHFSGKRRFWCGVIT